MVAALPVEFSETLPAVPGSVPLLRNKVARFAAAAGATNATLESVRIAVSEAVTNATVHAYIDDAHPGSVRVTAMVRDGAVHVTVSDDGRGMLPRLDSPGLGLGLPLIVQATDTFDVHGPAGGGAEIRMCFRLVS